MSGKTSSLSNNTLSNNYYGTLSYTVKFWVLLVFLIPSIICSLFVLYHFLFGRTLRHALNNHVIIVVLIIDLIYDVTVYPWMLYYYNSNGVWERSLIFCEIWGFIDDGLSITQTMLVAWATIERHILIFHDRWVSTRKKRCFVHYLPLIILLLYCLIFYFVISFIPPCQNFSSHVAWTCVYFCFYDVYMIFMWDTIGHQMLPVLLIVVFSITLLMRLLWQKHRIHQPIQWRKYRKMTVQLLSISLLYFLTCFPYILVSIMSFFGLLPIINANLFDYVYISTYFMILLSPFVCALTLPELRTKINNIVYFRKQTRPVDPGIFFMKNDANNRICVH